MADRGVTLGLTGAQELRRDLRAMAEGATGPQVVGAMLAGAEIIRAAAIDKVPKKTGKLSRTIKAVVTNKAKARAEVAVQTKSPLAHLIELGVTPHVIEPKKKQALMIPGVGPRAKVNHPGFQARPFLRPAFDENETRALVAVRDALWKSISEGTGAK